MLIIKVRVNFRVVNFERKKSNNYTANIILTLVFISEINKRRKKNRPKIIFNGVKVKKKKKKKKSV